MAAPSKVVELRRLLTKKFPGAHQTQGEEPCFETGIAPLDDIGLPKGAVTELVSMDPSSGSALLLHELIRAAAHAGKSLALIDGKSSLDPQSFSEETYQRLLWICCRTAAEAMKAADLVLRDGNLPLVVVDLSLNPAIEVRRLGSQMWFRLQTLVAKTAAVCLAMTPMTTVPSARLRLTLQHSHVLEDLNRRTPQLLGALNIRVTRRRVTAGSDPLERKAVG